MKQYESYRERDNFVETLSSEARVINPFTRSPRFSAAWKNVIAS